MNRALPLAAVVCLLAISAFGCVRRSEYDAKVAELQSCRAGCQQELQKNTLWAQMLGKQAADLKSQLETRTSKANTDLSELQKQFDDSTALVNGLRAELQRTGADVDKLMKEKGTLSATLEQTKKRLEELRKAEEAAQRRAE